MHSHTLSACRDELSCIIKEGKGGIGKVLKKIVGTAEQAHPSIPPSIGGVVPSVKGVAPTLADAAGSTLHASPQAIHAATGGAAGEPGIMRRIGEHLHKYEDPYEVGGLGVLGAIGADRLQAHARAGVGAPEEAIEHKQLLGESGHAALDTAGLGILAAPLVAKRAITGKWAGH